MKKNPIFRLSSPPMRMNRITCLFVLLFLGFTAPAQEILTDTFFRKDGIHLVPEFEPWQDATMFMVKSGKGKRVSTQPLLPLDACEKIKYYSNALAQKKEEPFRLFRVLIDLEGHDSSAYFQMLGDMPPAYQSFFQGLFYMEYNHFEKAVPLFDKVFTVAGNDSLLSKETPFWQEAAKRMANEYVQHAAVFSAYTLMQQPRPDSVQLAKILEAVRLPQYQMHKFINLFNFSFRKNDYGAALSLYDSVLTHTSYSKMKSSLTKNRNGVLEILDAKERFVDVRKKGIYHYEVDDLYDNLTTWSRDTLADMEFVTMAGFVLSPKLTSKTDTVFVRRLMDTAVNGSLSKFEMLSFIRTPLDKAGRRFVIVKLGFDNEDAWTKYLAFLEKFKNKPVQQSVLYNKAGVEGKEYMLTNHFIAALYKQEHPVIKYELSVYLLQDVEGNVYAVDTLF
jgi:hypothetical protein